MNELIRYLLQSTVCLTILYLVFLVFLRKETFFTANRIYLQMAVLFSLLSPLFPIRLPPVESITPMMVFLEPVLITSGKIETLAARHVSWMETIGIIYLTGVLIFTLRFLIQLFQLGIVIRRFGISQRDQMKLVFMEEGYSPFSFFNLVFIRRELSEHQQFKAILQHEHVHVRQWHSIDLILTEILTIVQWFNPFVWILQRSVKSLHEYLADEGVMKTGFRRLDYQQLLFNQILGKQINNLTNNFTVSLIQKRIVMMTKNRSNITARMKIILAIPVLFFTLVYISSASMIYLTVKNPQPETVQDASPGSLTNAMGIGSDKNDTIYKVVEKMPVFAEGVTTLINYLSSNIKYPDEAKEKGIQGTVFVTFVVEKDGSVSTVKVLRGIGAGCDEEAVRVIKNMPKWTPGYNEGKPVRVAFNLPVKYVLSKKEKAPAETK